MNPFRIIWIYCNRDKEQCDCRVSCRFFSKNISLRFSCLLILISTFLVIKRHSSGWWRKLAAKLWKTIFFRFFWPFDDRKLYYGWEKASFMMNRCFQTKFWFILQPQAWKFLFAAHRFLEISFHFELFSEIFLPLVDCFIHAWG